MIHITQENKQKVDSSKIWTLARCSDLFTAYTSKTNSHVNTHSKIIFKSEFVLVSTALVQFM